MYNLNELKNQYIETLKKIEKFLENYKEWDVEPIIYSNLKEKILIPQKKPKKENINPFIKEEKKTDKILSENQACTLCKNKLYAVRNYFKKPVENPKNILIISYNGSLDEKKIPKDMSHQYYFGSLEEDQLFNKMLENVNLNLKNLYFMEFIACHFSPNSTKEEWEERVKNCFYYLNKNIQENKIEKLLIVGNTALLLFQEEAQSLAKQSSIINFKLENLEIPSLIIRSPFAILTIEKIRKEFETKLEKYKEEYKLFLERKKELAILKEEIKNSIQKETKVKMINNIKLTPASQLKTEKEIEKEIRAKLGEGKYILYKAISTRLEEIQLKQQILNSLKKLIT